jgi:hypothetical protein
VVGVRFIGVAGGWRWQPDENKEVSEWSEAFFTVDILMRDDWMDDRNERQACWKKCETDCASGGANIQMQLRRRSRPVREED